MEQPMTGPLNNWTKNPGGPKPSASRLESGTGLTAGQLEKFTNHPEVGVLEAKNAVDLASYIRYATVTASIASSRIQSVPGIPQSNVVLPAAPAPASSSGNINLTVF